LTNPLVRPALEKAGQRNPHRRLGIERLAVDDQDSGQRVHLKGAVEIHHKETQRAHGKKDVWNAHNIKAHLAGWQGHE
jgi:hypothetical protein